MLPECFARGSESQTMSNSGLHAKYAVFTWARPSGGTVAIAQRVEASSRRRAAVANRAAATGRFDRSIAIASPVKTRYRHTPHSTGPEVVPAAVDLRWRS